MTSALFGIFWGKTAERPLLALCRSAHDGVFVFLCGLDLVFGVWCLVFGAPRDKDATFVRSKRGVMYTPWNQRNRAVLLDTAATKVKLANYTPKGPPAHQGRIQVVIGKNKRCGCIVLQQQYHRSEGLRVSGETKRCDRSVAHGKKRRQPTLMKSHNHRNTKTSLNINSDSVSP